VIQRHVQPIVKDDGNVPSADAGATVLRSVWVGSSRSSPESRTGTPLPASCLADAQAWLRDEGLREFDDQTARGEIFLPDGETVWFASHLQAVNRTKWDLKSAAVRFWLASI